MGIAIDLLVVAIFALLIIGGYRRGLLQAVVGLLGAFLCSILSSIGGSMLSIGIYNSFIMPSMINKFKEITPVVYEFTDIKEVSHQLFQTLPPYAINALTMSGVTESSLTEKIQSTEMEIPSLLEMLVRPIILRLVTVILTIALFIVLVSILALITKTIMGVVDTAGLGTVNKVLGAVLGLLEATILVMIFSLIFYFLVVLLPAENASIMREALDQSYIYRFINQFNIPDMIISRLSNYTF